MTELEQAKDPNTPPEVLDTLACHSTSPEVLDNLAKSLNANVRYIVALNPHASADTLAFLAADMDISIVRAVTRNPSADAPTLVRLAKLIKHMDIRYNISKHPNTPEVVKIFFNSGGYAGMSLAEFMAATGDTYERQAK